MGYLHRVVASEAMTYVRSAVRAPLDSAADRILRDCSGVTTVPSAMMIRTAALATLDR
jgi:hypothetical protein